MCRKNQLLGGILIAFAAGLLLGLWLDGGFFSVCMGVGIGIFGVMTCKK